MATGIVTIPCEVCGVNTSGPEQYEQHISGKMHKKNLAKDGKTETGETHKCDVCNLECTGLIPWQQHLEGKNHAKNYRKAMLEIGLEQEGPAPKLYPSLEEFSEPKVTSHKCHECNVVCSGVEALIAHKKGKKHARQVKLLQFHQNNFPAPMSDDGMNQSSEELRSNYIIRNSTSPENTIQLLDISDDSIRESDNGSPKYPPQSAYNLRSNDSIRNGTSPENARQHLLVDMSDQSDLKPHEHQDSEELETSTMISEETEQLKFKCHDCNIACTGPESYMQHMNGKQHAKKIKAISGISNVTLPMSDESMNQSIDDPQLNDSIHNTSLHESDIISQKYLAHLDVKLQDPEETEVNFKCNVCDIACTGPESYVQHMEGKQHAKKIKLIKFYQTQAASNEVVQAPVDEVESGIEGRCDQETDTSTVKDLEAENSNTQNVAGKISDADNDEMTDEGEGDAAKKKKHKFKNIFKKKSKKNPCEA